MVAAAKTTQLQIRVSPAEKAAILRAARRAGLDMSAYVLARVLPAPAKRFRELVEACRDPEGGRHALAELNSWLAELGAGDRVRRCRRRLVSVEPNAGSASGAIERIQSGGARSRRAHAYSTIAAT